MSKTTKEIEKLELSFRSVDGMLAGIESKMNKLIGAFNEHLLGHEIYGDIPVNKVCDICGSPDCKENDDDCTCGFAKKDGLVIQCSVHGIRTDGNKKEYINSMGEKNGEFIKEVWELTITQRKDLEFNSTKYVN
jgi:hypothetical protein